MGCCLREHLVLGRTISKSRCYLPLPCSESEPPPRISRSSASWFVSDQLTLDAGYHSGQHAYGSLAWVRDDAYLPDADVTEAGAGAVDSLAVFLG